MTSNAHRPVVGFIGLGDQGLPMATAIGEAGFAVHTWARRPETLNIPEVAAFTVAPSVEALARAADVVALCVSTDEAVLSLAEQILPVMRPGGVLVNHGTGTPETARRLARRGADHGVAVLDAPVSGGRPGAKARTLLTLVGGDAAVLDRVRPVFESFSAHVLHLGPAGSGQQAKLFNNALMLLNQNAIADVLALAAGTGADVAALVSALRLGSAASRALELVGTMIRPDTADHLAEVGALDMEIFDQALRADGADTEILDRVVAFGTDGARRAPATSRLLP
jgi:3-hydroxyisobutyrate dehydrogenase-like beta-hydroxyacid dehydrogenase